MEHKKKRREIFVEKNFRKEILNVDLRIPFYLTTIFLLFTLKIKLNLNPNYF